MNIWQIGINKTFQSDNKNNNTQLRGFASSVLSGEIIGGALYPLGYSSIKAENKGLGKSAIAKKALPFAVSLGAMSVVLHASGIDDVFVKEPKNNLTFNDRGENIGILSVLGLGAAAGAETLAGNSKNFLGGLKKYSLPAAGVAIFSVLCAYTVNWLKNDRANQGKMNKGLKR